MGDGDEGEMGSGLRRRGRRGSRMERAGQIATGSPRTKTELSVVPEILFKLSLISR